MPEWVLRLLLGVFVVHLLLFGRLFLRHRQAYHGLVTLTFLLLVGSFSLRLVAPAWQIGGIAAYTLPRMMAWTTAAISVGILLRRRWRRRTRSAAENSLLADAGDPIDEEVDRRH